MTDSCSAWTPSCFAASRANAERQVVVAADRPRRSRSLERAISKARASVHSERVVLERADESDRSPGREDDTVQTRTKVELGLDAGERGLRLRRDEDGLRRERDARVAFGSAWPDCMTAAPPNAGWVSSIENPCSDETCASARLASAMTSGPIPCPARQATL